jgi:uncharacterized lipoprotein YbaY
MLVQRTWGALAGLVLALGVGSACADVLRGEVVFRERIALPPNTVLQVQVVDAALQDVAAEVLADTRATAIAGPPYSFALAIEPAWLAPPRRLQVQATLRAAGRLLMINDEAYPLTPAALAAPMTIVVRGVGEPAMSRPDFALVCRGNEPFWNLELQGAQAHFSSMAGGWPSGGDFAGALDLLDWARPAQFVWRGGPPLGEPLVAVGRVERCFDTMADRPASPWSVTLVMPGGGTALGCCEPPE